jgi:alpha-1,3-rhamnosyltransferase
MTQPAADPPLVSIIIASYNHCAFIEKSITSVLTQTYPNIELLVVDDGSTDGSVEHIQRLQQLHGFSFLAQENKGLSRTLNETIARARGNLIAPFGSDDVMLPARIALQVAYLRDKPKEEIDAQGYPLGKFRDLPRRRLDFEDVFLDRKTGAPAPTLLFRREALEKVGGFDPQIRLEDLLIQLKITRAGYSIDVLNEVLAHYRVHGSNTYKNHRFMTDNVLRTYAQFSDHPAYAQVCTNFRNSMLLKCARQDKNLARELLAQLPLRTWNAKTLRGLWRLALPHNDK